jgi:hypothetical protein
MHESDALDLSLSGSDVRAKDVPVPVRIGETRPLLREHAQNISLRVSERVIDLTLPLKSASWRYSARIARKRSRT